MLAVAAAILFIVLGNTSGDPQPDAGAGSREPLPQPSTERAEQEPARAPEAVAPGPPVEKAIWGPVEMPDGSPAFPVYRRLGVDTFQIQLRWADVAPQRPANPIDPAEPSYRWPPEIETAIRDGSRMGIDVAVLVTTTPSWANGGGAEIQAPENPSDFGVFLAAAAKRYPQVHRWMIWGEPNRADRFQPNAPDSPIGPRAYAVLLDVAYRALKNASSRNIVIGGMSYTGGDVKPPDFLRWMRLPDGRVPRLDWFGINPYPFRYPDLTAAPIAGGWRDLSDLDTFGREVKAAYRQTGTSPPLWISEFTVQSDRDSRYFEFHVTEEEQARWLQAGFRAAAAAGGVKGMGWFTLLDQPLAPGSADWGLMTSSGEPKPAFGAFESVAGG